MYGFWIMVVQGLTFFVDANPDLTGWLTAFGGLAGFGVLTAALVGLLKRLGIVPDGAAGLAQLVINLVGFNVFIGVSVFFPDIDIEQVDSTLAGVGSLLVSLTALLGQLGVSKLTYAKFLRGRGGILGFLGFAHDQI